MRLRWELLAGFPPTDCRRRKSTTFHIATTGCRRHCCWYIKIHSWSGLLLAKTHSQHGWDQVFFRNKPLTGPIWRNRPKLGIERFAAPQALSGSNTTTNKGIGGLPRLTRPPRHHQGQGRPRIEAIGPREGAQKTLKTRNSRILAVSHEKMKFRKFDMTKVVIQRCNRSYIVHNTTRE